MTDLYVDWNSDFLLTTNGDLQTATGWDEVRQRIVRNLITNSGEVLPSGVITAPDYIFHPLWGLGLGSKIGENPTTDWRQQLISRINAAVLADAAVDQGQMPTVVFQQGNPGTWQVFVTVPLADGTAGSITLSMKH